jgi:hypothetical protein
MAEGSPSGAAEEVGGAESADRCAASEAEEGGAVMTRKRKSVPPSDYNALTREVVGIQEKLRTMFSQRAEVLFEHLDSVDEKNLLKLLAAFDETIEFFEDRRQQIFNTPTARKTVRRWGGKDDDQSV